MVIYKNLFLQPWIFGRKVGLDFFNESLLLYDEQICTAVFTPKIQWTYLT